MLDGGPDTLTEGYTTSAEHPSGTEYYWICPRCYADFAATFVWRVVDE